MQLFSRCVFIFVICLWWSEATATSLQFFRIPKTRGFLLYRTNSISQRPCTCSTTFSCSCCEIVTLLYSKRQRKLCSNFMYQRNGLNIDISLDTDTLKTTSVSVYRPLKLCSSIPGSFFSSICVDVIELNEFPRSLTVCVRHKIVSKVQEWQIDYTCVSISTELPTLTNDTTTTIASSSVATTTTMASTATSSAPMTMATSTMTSAMTQPSTTMAQTSSTTSGAAMNQSPSGSPPSGPPPSGPPPNGGPPSMMAIVGARRKRRRRNINFSKLHIFCTKIAQRVGIVNDGSPIINQKPEVPIIHDSLSTILKLLPNATSGSSDQNGRLSVLDVLNESDEKNAYNGNEYFPSRIPPAFLKKFVEKIHVNDDNSSALLQNADSIRETKDALIFSN